VSHMEFSSVHGEGGARDPRRSWGEEEHCGIRNVGLRVSLARFVRCTLLTSVSHTTKRDLRLRVEPFWSEFLHSDSAANRSAVSDGPCEAPSPPETHPGPMTLDRTPLGPSSTAITALRASTPALAALTCAW